MPKGRGYDIFPRTWLPRVLLGLAFAAGLAIMAGWVAVIALSFIYFDIFDEVEVTVENRTERLLTIYVSGQSEAVVPPGQTRSITTLKIQWRFGGALVQAVDDNGVIVFEDDLDLGDLEDVDYHIVIEAPVGGLAIAPPVHRVRAGGLPGGADRTRARRAVLVRGLRPARLFRASGSGGPGAGA